MLKNIETTKGKKDILLEAFNNGNLPKVKTILKKCHSRLEILKLCDLFYNAYKTSFLDICSYLLEVNQNNICSRILEYACQKNDIEFVNYLIPLLPSIDVQLEESERENMYRHTPLTIACKNNNMELAKILLDAGANVNWSYKKDVNMCIQADVDTPLHYAVERNNIELVQLLLDREADVNILGWCYSNVIESACQNKNIEMVKLLIEHGADIYFKRWLKRSALHHACSSVHYNNLDPELDTKTILDFIEYIMSFGFDVDIRDEWENTPLHYAFDNKEINMSIVEYLISKGANINAQDNKGETVFYKSSLEMKEYLLRHGANPDIANDDGDTAFLQAAYYCNLEMLELLVKYGADVYATNKNGENALHLACLFYSAEIEDIEYLLSLGVDPHAITDDGETVLHYAFKAGMIEIGEYLIGIGVDWRIKDNKGCSILHAHCSSYRSTVYGAEYLVSLGLDADERSDDGRTALLHAAYDGHTDVMDYLIEQGSDIQARSNDGKTALHWSCEYSIGLYRPTYLADIGIDVNAQDDKGETYIHKLLYGCGYNHISKPIIDHLLECGARLDIKDNEGHTVIDICKL